jgi:hypothetical protein
MMCPHCSDENRRSHPFVAESDHAAMTTRIVYRYCPRCKRTYMITMVATPEEYHGRSKQITMFQQENCVDN